MKNNLTGHVVRGVTRGLTTALMLAVAGGCVLQGETAPEIRYYVLGSVASDSPALPGAPAHPALVVDLASLSLPQYLQRAEIVTRVDENRLLLNEFDQWGGNLEKNVHRVIAANLAGLLATPDVHIAARRLPSGVDVRVEIEVMQFERGPDGRALLGAQWRVLDADERTLVSRITNLASPAVGARDTMQTTVAAMSELLGELSRRIAVAVIESRRAT